MANVKWDSAVTDKPENPDDIEVPASFLKAAQHLRSLGDSWLARDPEGYFRAMIEESNQDLERQLREAGDNAKCRTKPKLSHRSPGNGN